MTVSKRAVLERIYALAPRGALLGLERVTDACAILGHPEKRFASVHIAGTNGKGSVAAMVAAMCGVHGVRTGLYTSPHLCQFRERIQVGGEPVSEDALYPALERVLDRCPELTFFEAATVAAFAVFAEQEAELAIVEVGLGGRLDATNVLPTPRATAITRIALDHTDWLGNDLASIAMEKAGILKAGSPVVLGPLDPVSLTVVMNRAREVGAPVRRTADDAELATFVEHHPPALLGAHQRENAKIAVALGRELGLSAAAMSEGLSRVRWPGRLELLKTAEGSVLLDAAHNPDGAKTLAAALADMHIAPTHICLVFGAMADKDSASMLSLLSPLAEHRVYITPEGRRAADPVALARQAPGSVAATVADALETGRKTVGALGLVVVAGSIFLVGAARAHLLGLLRDPVIAL